MKIDESTAPEPRLSYQIARLHRLIRARLGEVLSPFGVSLPQYTVLSVLQHRSGLSNAQLARRAYVTPQAMHQILTSLEAAGLVMRKTSSDHGQVRLASLTPSGEKLLTECDAAVDALECELFSRLSETERSSLGRLIQRSIQ